MSKIQKSFLEVSWIALVQLINAKFHVVSLPHGKCTEFCICLSIFRCHTVVVPLSHFSVPSLAKMNCLAMLPSVPWLPHLDHSALTAISTPVYDISSPFCSFTKPLAPPSADFRPVSSIRLTIWHHDTVSWVSTHTMVFHPLLGLDHLNHMFGPDLRHTIHVKNINKKVNSA